MHENTCQWLGRPTAWEAEISPYNNEPPLWPNPLHYRPRDHDIPQQQGPPDPFAFSSPLYHPMGQFPGCLQQQNSPNGYYIPSRNSFSNSCRVFFSPCPYYGNGFSPHQAYFAPGTQPSPVVGTVYGNVPDQNYDQQQVDGGEVCEVEDMLIHPSSICHSGNNSGTSAQGQADRCEQACEAVPDDDNIVRPIPTFHSGVIHSPANNHAQTLSQGRQFSAFPPVPTNFRVSMGQRRPGSALCSRRGSRQPSVAGTPTLSKVFIGEWCQGRVPSTCRGSTMSSIPRTPAPSTVSMGERRPQAAPRGSRGLWHTPVPKPDPLQVCEQELCSRSVPNSRDLKQPTTPQKPAPSQISVAEKSPGSIPGDGCEGFQQKDVAKMPPPAALLLKVVGPLPNGCEPEPHMASDGMHKNAAGKREIDFSKHEGGTKPQLPTNTEHIHPARVAMINLSTVGKAEDWKKNAEYRSYQQGDRSNPHVTAPWFKLTGNSVGHPPDQHSAVVPRFHSSLNRQSRNNRHQYPFTAPINGRIHKRGRRQNETTISPRHQRVETGEGSHLKQAFDCDDAKPSIIVERRPPTKPWHMRNKPRPWLGQARSYQTPLQSYRRSYFPKATCDFYGWGSKYQDRGDYPGGSFPRQPRNWAKPNPALKIKLPNGVLDADTAAKIYQHGRNLAQILNNKTDVSKASNKQDAESLAINGNRNDSHRSNNRLEYVARSAGSGSRLGRAETETGGKGTRGSHSIIEERSYNAGSKDTFKSNTKKTTTETAKPLLGAKGKPDNRTNDGGNEQDDVEMETKKSSQKQDDDKSWRSEYPLLED
jgi:hypothetical protein